MRILSLVRSRNTRLVKGDHTLNTDRSPEDQFKSLLWWKATCDKRTYGSRPALDEDIEILDSRCEGLGPGVHCAKEHLVLQYHIAHQASRVCLNERLQSGDTGEHKDTVDP